MQPLPNLVSPFLALSAADVALMKPYLRPGAWEPGEPLFREGEICRDVVLLGSGLVRAYYIHEAREVNLRFLCAPAVAVAMSSFITGQAANETVQAVTAVTGFRARLSDFCAEHPGELAERTVRVLVERHYLSMERRLRMLQWKSAQERYAYFLEHVEPEIVEGMPGYHIASYLGVTPESLSRVRSKRSRPRRS